MFINIAGYQFVYLTKLNQLQNDFLETCQHLNLKGTILLSEEGINISLAGEPHSISAFKKSLETDLRFKHISFRDSTSTTIPFKRLKIKIKSEIITFRKKDVSPLKKSAKYISPENLKQWLDNKNDVVLLDTRNDFEIQFGTFTDAINLNLKHFSDFPNVVKTLDRNKTIITFCTGGIRCEKAALLMMNEGFTNVCQLEGGILNYFRKVGGTHYKGSCFVFDDRIAIDPELKPIKKIS